MREYGKMDYGFERPAMNEKGVLCSKSYEYFGGPHFNDEGKWR